MAFYDAANLSVTNDASSTSTRATMGFHSSISIGRPSRPGSPQSWPSLSPLPSSQVAAISEGDANVNQGHVTWRSSAISSPEQINTQALPLGPSPRNTPVPHQLLPCRHWPMSLCPTRSSSSPRMGLSRTRPSSHTMLNRKSASFSLMCSILVLSISCIFVEICLVVVCMSI